RRRGHGGACIDAASIAASEIRTRLRRPRLQRHQYRFAGGQFAIDRVQLSAAGCVHQIGYCQEISVRTGTRTYAGLELGSCMALDDGLCKRAQVAVAAPHDLDRKITWKFLKRGAAHSAGVPASSRV